MLKQATQKHREPITIGSYSISFTPHMIRGIGPRIFLEIKDNHLKAIELLNLCPDGARAIADRLKIAACESESMARNDTRRQKHADEA